MSNAAPVTWGSRTNVTDDTVTIDASDLSVVTDYAIQIDAGAFEDTENTDFSGITDDTPGISRPVPTTVAHPHRTTQLNNSGDSFGISVVTGDSKYKKSTALRKNRNARRRHPAGLAQ